MVDYIMSKQWRFWGFHFGGHWGGDTFIWGHPTNTFALNYPVIIAYIEF